MPPTELKLLEPIIPWHWSKVLLCVSCGTQLAWKLDGTGRVKGVRLLPIRFLYDH